MPGGKTPCRRSTFDIGQQQATGRDRKQFLKLQHSEAGQLESRQAFRDLSGDGYAHGRKPEQGCDQDRQGHDGEPDRPARQQPLTQQQEQDRNNSNGQSQQMDIAELARNPDRPVEEVVAAAGDSQQARQLAHDDGEPGPRLEADQNAVADQSHENAELEDPGDQAKHRYRACGEARDLRVSDRVSSGQSPEGAGHHQRDRRGRTDRQLAR